MTNLDYYNLTKELFIYRISYEFITEIIFQAQKGYYFLKDQAGLTFEYQSMLLFVQISPNQINSKRYKMSSILPHVRGANLIRGRRQ